MGFYNGKNVLIAGAGGIVGHAAVKRLLHEGAHVRATIHTANEYDIQDVRLEIKKYDFMNIEDCVNAVKDMEIVIDCLAYVPGREKQSALPMPFIRHNLFLFMNLAEAACEAKVDRFGFIGSSAVYPSSNTPLKENESLVSVPCEFFRGMGWLKRYTEQVCKHYQDISNTKFGMIRIGAVYGPYDTFNTMKNHVVADLITRAANKENPFVVWGNGNNQVRDFLYVDDLVDGLLLTLEKHAIADPINIVSGKHTTLTELVEIIINKSGYFPKIIYDVTKPINVPYRILDNVKAKEVLQWVATTTLENGIEKTIQWYKENKK
jgi:GDP-L-fucose synthase